MIVLNHALTIVAILSLGFALSGCEASRTATSGKPAQEVKLFYATDRKPDPKAPGEFANDRAGFDRLSYGIRTVVLPAERDKGEDKNVQLTGGSPFSTKADFYRELTKTVNGAPQSDVFLYVHGYNNDFHAAAIKGAVYAADVGNQKASPFGLIFSWPSRHKLLAYLGDKDSADLAQPHLTRLIRDLNDDTNLHGKRLILIGHSMGCRALVTAIKNEYFYDGYYIRGQKGERVHRDLPPVCDYLFLIEPDIDLGIFQRDIHLISPLCKRIVVYQSNRDKAIAASSFVHTFPRAGNAVGKNPNFANVDFVNMSTEKTDFIGHSYDNPDFIDQLADRVAHPPSTSQDQASTQLESSKPPVPESIQIKAKESARAAQPDAKAAASVSTPAQTPIYQIKKAL